jgi:hypothetical protein
VDPFLKQIGTCPFSALEGKESFRVEPANFTCPKDKVLLKGKQGRGRRGRGRYWIWR